MRRSVSAAFGAKICVNTPVEFQNALFQAAQNQEDDLIKVQQGTYAGYDLYHSFTKEHNNTVTANRANLGDGFYVLLENMDQP